jgi:hypothetical protein
MCLCLLSASKVSSRLLFFRIQTIRKFKTLANEKPADKLKVDSFSIFKTLIIKIYR